MTVYGDPLGVLYRIVFGTRKCPNGEVLSITHRAEGRSNPGVDEVSGLILSGVSFGGTWDGNLDSSGSVEGDHMVN